MEEKNSTENVQVEQTADRKDFCVSGKLVNKDFYDRFYFSNVDAAAAMFQLLLMQSRYESVTLFKRL